MKESVQVLLRQSEYSDIRRWVAQGLEYDVAAEGESPSQALERFVDAFMCEQAFAKQDGVDLKERAPRAPEEFWEQYGQSESGRLPDYFPDKEDSPVPTVLPCIVPA